jgi:hypothetical protein
VRYLFVAEPRSRPPTTHGAVGKMYLDATASGRLGRLSHQACRDHVCTTILEYSGKAPVRTRAYYSNSSIARVIAERSWGTEMLVPAPGRASAR